MARTKSILIAGITAWLLVRVLCLFYIQNLKLFEVHDIAVNMIEKGEMVYFLNGQMNYNYQFPVYPFFLYVVYQCFGILPKAGIILNLIFHSLAVLLSFRVFRWFTQNSSFDIIRKQANTISLLASLALLFHPLINYYTIMMIHSFSLNLFLLVLCLYYTTKYFNTPNSKNLIFLSISYGLAVLDRTTAVVYIIPLLIYLISTQSFRLALPKIAFTLAMGLLFISPWIYRNYSIYHSISINSSLGQNLWLGVQPETSGSAYLLDNRTYYNLIPDSEWVMMSKLNAVQQSDYFQNKYVQIIQQHPSLFFKMYLIKLKNFWFFRDHIGTEYSPSIKRFIPLYFVAYSFVVLLVLFFVYYDKKMFYFCFLYPYVCLYFMLFFMLRRGIE